MSESAHPAGNAQDPDSVDTTPLPRVQGPARSMPMVHGELPMNRAAAPPHMQQQPPPQAPPVQRQPLPPQPPPRRGQGPQQEPEQRPRRSRFVRYTAYALGLVGVAAVSGLIWWAAHPSSGPTAGQAAQTSVVPPPQGKYQFAQAHGSVRDGDCEKHAYGKIKKFFHKTPCEQLKRTLYWTRVDGVRVFTGVRVVTMPNPSGAADLEKLTDTDGTGNVADLLKDGIRVSGAPDTVKGGAYASARDSDTVTIVESKPEVGKKLPDDVLEKVSNDALRLGR